MMLLLFTASLLLNQADFESHWQKANQAYQDGAYAEALAAYESLLSEGVANGPLHFNLGNAYQKNGQLGKAMLHYYKAQRFLPGDEDVANNIALVSKMRVDPVIEEEQEGFQSTLDRVIYGLNYSYLFMGCAIFLCLAGLASILLIFRSSSGKWLGYVLVISGVVGLAMLGAAFVQYDGLVHRRYAVILAPEIDVLSGPSTRETVNFTLHEGIRCQILDETEGWYRIRLANGYNGWVPQQALEGI